MVCSEVFTASVPTGSEAGGCGVGADESCKTFVSVCCYTYVLYVHAHTLIQSVCVCVCMYVCVCVGRADSKLA